MPLLHDTSMVSSPEVAGRVPPSTLTVMMLFAFWSIPLAAQNFVRSLVRGTVSMTMPIRWPAPVSPLAATLYAVRMSLTV